MAREAYAAERTGQLSSGRAPVVGMPHYEGAALEDVLARTVMAALLVTDPVPRATVVQAVTAVSRHGEMAGRDMLILSVESDRGGAGWARVLTGPRENCAFCAVLVSRGPRPWHWWSREGQVMIEARRWINGAQPARWQLEFPADSVESGVRLGRWPRSWADG